MEADEDKDCSLLAFHPVLVPAATLTCVVCIKQDPKAGRYNEKDDHDPTAAHRWHTTCDAGQVKAMSLHDVKHEHLKEWKPNAPREIDPTVPQSLRFCLHD